MDIKVQNKKGEIDLSRLEELMAQVGAGQVAGSDFKKETKDLAALGSGVNVLSIVDMPRNRLPGVAPVATGINELDEPDCAAARKRVTEDSLTLDSRFGALLEKIVDLLLNESGNTGMKTAEERLKSLLAKLKVDFQVTLKNLQKELDKSEETTKLRNKMKALGWLMAIFGALMAALSALTAGGALGIAVAVVGVLGATVGIVQQARQEGIKKDAEKYADTKIREYEKNNVDPSKRKSRTELVQEYTDKVSKIYMGVSLTFGILGLAMGAAAIGMAVRAAKEVAAKAAEMALEMLKKKGVDVTTEIGKKALEELTKELTKELSKEAAKQTKTLLQKMLRAKAPDAAFVQKISLGVSATGILGNGSTAGTSAGFNFENAKRQKELAEWNARHVMAKRGADLIQKAIDEETDALMAALVQLGENAGKLSEMLGDEADTNNELARRIGNVGRAI